MQDGIKSLFLTNKQGRTRSGHYVWQHEKNNDHVARWSLFFDACWENAFIYSYANVSRTVSMDARLAGIALASVAIRSIPINQAMIPLTP